MRARLLKKAGLLLIFLWAAGSLTFFLVRAIPGDPLLSILGPHPRQEDVLRLQHTLQLDRAEPEGTGIARSFGLSANRHGRIWRVERCATPVRGADFFFNAGREP